MIDAVTRRPLSVAGDRSRAAPPGRRGTAVRSQHPLSPRERGPHL